eukprot:CAMPEP_0184860840 /NCGR_PEP_ID=MMETSP0580-20130426/5648_1 /TAXON_ID=1118495 /ORGANISM="Dactyliosolen fragilissimus" /LENGTH=526 /DNA_ID=CAMNT_0027358095 /DNA_START=300 /DNA_END=1877 /DNA_ORIENTATION=+
MFLSLQDSNKDSEEYKNCTDDASDGCIPIDNNDMTSIIHPRTRTRNRTRNSVKKREFVSRACLIAIVNAMMFSSGDNKSNKLSCVKVCNGFPMQQHHQYHHQQLYNHYPKYTLKSPQAPLSSLVNTIIDNGTKRHGGIINRSFSRLFAMMNEEEGVEEENDDEEIDLDVTSCGTVEEARHRFEVMMSLPNDDLPPSLRAQQQQQQQQQSSDQKSQSSNNIIPNKSDQSQGRGGEGKEEEQGEENITQSSPSISFFKQPSPSSQMPTQPQPQPQPQPHTISRLRSIEALISSSSTSSPNYKDQPPFTTIMRERREAEIHLLSSLENNDIAINDLWSLWFAERGPKAATLLLRAEELASRGPPHWDQAEQLLWDLIEEHGHHWSEPINRLATLMYMKGNLEQSRQLCELVLQNKPWHFGALSGIVLVCAGTNDVAGARMWADRRLPPLVPEIATGSRRKLWVQRAVHDAQERLQIAERSKKHIRTGREEIQFRKWRDNLENQTNANTLDNDNNSNSNSNSNSDPDSIW